MRLQRETGVWAAGWGGFWACVCQGGLTEMTRGSHWLRHKPPWCGAILQWLVLAAETARGTAAIHIEPWLRAARARLAATTALAEVQASSLQTLTQSVSEHQGTQP